MEIDELWDHVCGENSLVQLFDDTHGLQYLVDDLIIELVENEKFQAYATIDADDGKTPLIRLTTGTYKTILECIKKGVDIIKKQNRYPWVDLGFKQSDFKSSSEFCIFISKIIMDFVVVHEIGHVVRGHIDQAVKSSGVGLYEIEENNNKPAAFPNIRRIALELDADSIAIYILVGLSHFLLDNSKLYSRARNVGVLVATIGLASKILFGILGDAQLTDELSNKRSLIKNHKGLTHPIPSIREEFSHQRIIQLAIDEEEISIFSESLESSYSLFIAMIGESLFPSLVMESWLYNTDDVADFMNILIAEIEVAETEGWMDSSRISKSVDLIQSFNT